MVAKKSWILQIFGKLVMYLHVYKFKKSTLDYISHKDVSFAVFFWNYSELIICKIKWKKYDTLEYSWFVVKLSCICMINHKKFLILKTMCFACPLQNLAYFRNYLWNKCVYWIIRWVEGDKKNFSWVWNKYNISISDEMFMYFGDWPKTCIFIQFWM